MKNIKTYNQFSNSEKINEEEQSPINLKALLAAKQQKLEQEAFKDLNNIGQPQEIGTPVNAPNTSS